MTRPEQFALPAHTGGAGELSQQANAGQPRTSGGPVGPAQECAAAAFAGQSDRYERLWTPHRIAYIKGEAKPLDKSESQCPFCSMREREDAEALVVRRTPLAFVVLNLFPYNTGHLLVCPWRHVADYTELTDAERTEIAVLTQQAMRVTRAVSGPDGFNLGMNQGEVAGAGIAAHLHQHVVPRWRGDANFLPIIAQTKALPELLADTRERLARAWDSVVAQGDDAAVPAGVSPEAAPSGTGGPANHQAGPATKATQEVSLDGADTGLSRGSKED